MKQKLTIKQLEAKSKNLVLPGPDGEFTLVISGNKKKVDDFLKKYELPKSLKTKKIIVKADHRFYVRFPSKKKTSGGFRKCTAESYSGKCIVYTAKHELKKAADAHSRKIRARGGKVKRKKEPYGKYIINYSFPNKKKSGNIKLPF